MRTIHQGHLPIRTLVLIGMVVLITRTGIRTECKCPTHNHIAKCYIEGVRQVNRKLYRIFFYLQ